MFQLEKQRKRREKHNAVERKRRDNINERIQELGLVIPDCANEPENTHKGVILRKAIDYIRELQGDNEILKKRLAELEAYLANNQKL